MSSMIMGIASLGDIRKLGRTGTYTLLYYMVTTGISVLIGIILVNVIQPGVGVETAQVVPEKVKGKEFSFIEVIMGLIPENIFASMAETQVLPLIIVSLVFGGILTTIGEKGEVVIRFFDGVNEVIMKIVRIIMFFAPLGVFGLVASKLGAMGGGDMFISELYKLGKYAITVIIGLIIHSCLILPIILILIARTSPLPFVYNMASALTTAFSTASSSATLPVTMECIEEKNRISKRTSSFVLPLGATINMDGTALYESVAAIFIAQAFGYELTFSHQVIIFFTATLAAIGAAGIPEAGLVTMVMVLHSVGLPLEGIGTILAIDWFLDRCRTTVNVWGDSVGCAVIDKRLKSEKL
jgi:Na+/H+-dicarboxylate symporter